MIKYMNTLRTKNDSARFGFTEYSDMTHDEFVAAKLSTDLTKDYRQINSIIKEPSLHNIIRYTRDAINDTDRLPLKIDW